MEKPLSLESPMKVTLTKTYSTDKVPYLTLTDLNTLETSKLTDITEKEPTPTTTISLMKENGTKVF